MKFEMFTKTIYLNKTSFLRLYSTTLYIYKLKLQSMKLPFYVLHDIYFNNRLIIRLLIIDYATLLRLPRTLDRNN